METVEGRGISNGNGVYFIFDAENDVVVMATYRDAPGVRSDLLKPNIVKAFTKVEWGESNEFLMAGADKYEDKEEIVTIHSERIDTFFPLRKEDYASTDNIQLPVLGTVQKMGNSEPIFPGKGLPAMTKSELEDNKENGKTDE